MEGKMLAPTDLGPEGQAAWDAMTKDAEFRPDEALLLGEACRLVDKLAEMRRKDVGDRDIRLAQEQLRKMLTSIRWDPASEGDMSGWQREMVNRRYRRKAGAQS